MTNIKSNKNSTQTEAKKSNLVGHLFSWLAPKHLLWHISVAFVLAIALPIALGPAVKPFIELMQLPKELFSLVVKVIAPIIAFSALYTGILKSLRSGSRKSFFSSVAFYLFMCAAAVVIAFPIGYVASEHIDSKGIRLLIEGNLAKGLSDPLAKAAATANKISLEQDKNAALLEKISGSVSNKQSAEPWAQLAQSEKEKAGLFADLGKNLEPTQESTFNKLSHSTILWAVCLAVLFAFVTDSKYRHAEFESVHHNEKNREEGLKYIKAADSFVAFFEWLKLTTIHVLFLMVAVLSPWAIIGALGSVISKYGPEVIWAYKDIILLVFLALFCQGIFLMVVTYVIAKVNPFRIMAMSKATLMLALSTSSSKACLPMAMAEVEKMGVGRRFVDYQVALGSSINMDGTAIYMGVISFIFSYAWLGHHLDIGTMVQLVFACTVFAIGAAGIPSGSLVFLTSIFPMVGVPAAAIFAIQPIDAILDRGRTVLNIWGDITGAVTRAAVENELDRSYLAAKPKSAVEATDPSLHKTAYLEK
ncbi:MAG: dicarboxylate/amino acid:cation symporter [Pseudobdellovibrionaceae bacterium]